MENTFYLNSENNKELTDKIFQIINCAKKYIKTGNFLFQDDKLNEALTKAANRGVAIFILTNIQGAAERGTTSLDLKLETNPHLPNLHNLHRKGIHINCYMDLHAKFIMSDGDNGLIMSSNYTFNSLYINPENGIDISGKELKDLERLFDTLYLHPDVILSEEGNNYKYTINKNPIGGNELNEIGSSNLLRITACGDKDKQSNLVRCNIHTIYDSIIGIIDRSQERLYIVSWSYNCLNKLDKFQTAIKDALKRNVHITLLYSEQASEQNVKRTKDQLSYLCRDVGKKLETKVFPSNHSKCVLSEKEGIMFTANIDGNRGLLKGFELGCILTEKQLIDANSKINKILK